MLRISVRKLVVSVVLWALVAANAAHAHFAWLALDEDNKAVFFFGESIAETTYHLPEKLAAVAVQAKSNEKAWAVEMKEVDTDELIGKQSTSPVADASTLHCSATYGIYQGSRLTYHCQHIAGPSDGWAQEANPELPIQAVVKPTDDGGVVVTVLVGQKPLDGAEVKLFCDEGHEEGKAKTNAQGQVQFTGKQVEDGLNGLMVGHVDPTAKGEYEGAEFTGEAHYLTVTFRK